MKTAIYCRVALADDSMIANQELSLLCYAAKNGYRDCVTYRDNGVSGLTLDRPGLNAMMKDVRDKRIQAVIVKDAARIARDYIAFMKIIGELDNFGVMLITPQDGVSATAPFKDLARCLKTGLALNI